MAVDEKEISVPSDAPIGELVADSPTTRSASSETRSVWPAPR